MVKTDCIFNAITYIPRFVSVINLAITRNYIIYSYCLLTIRLPSNPRIIFLKRLVAWFFQRKINRNATQLKKLRAEKKKILEQVTQKEVYNVACEILSRFGEGRPPHQLAGTFFRYLFPLNQTK